MSTALVDFVEFILADIESRKFFGQTESSAQNLSSWQPELSNHGSMATESLIWINPNVTEKGQQFRVAQKSVVFGGSIAGGREMYSAHTVVPSTSFLKAMVKESFCTRQV